MSWSYSESNAPAAGGRKMGVHMLRGGGFRNPPGSRKHAMQRLRTSEIPQDGQLSITGREDLWCIRTSFETVSKSPDERGAPNGQWLGLHCAGRHLIGGGGVFAFDAVKKRATAAEASFPHPGIFLTSEFLAEFFGHGRWLPDGWTGLESA
ncbi:uncharacterized protein BO80DRAFT_425871 [Aspergillus ibericus CBS 121593]|uniref:Uncharacterized protein n=1 Tax=Aspergillus ibericus CBS 121593 TaxID=1448316 RepID=A0A395H099_9EURO|nr:hypothetical protein BO80DRAFT_425871 [Aspergillus ibericus CBS 121593]RAL00368.1 hypothetical protein BO80DRAFT_425871 [Aspergillus ibericus CBS 121593]